MLKSGKRGIFITGMVDSVTEVQHRSGKTQKGGDYSFWQQTATFAIRGAMVEVVARADQDPRGPLLNFELDDVATVKVENPRVFNGKVSFDIAK